MIKVEMQAGKRRRLLLWAVSLPQDNYSKFSIDYMQWWPSHDAQVLNYPIWKNLRLPLTHWLLWHIECSGFEPSRPGQTKPYLTDQPDLPSWHNYLTYLPDPSGARCFFFTLIVREGFTVWWFAKTPSTLFGVFSNKKMTPNFLFWEWTIDAGNKVYTYTP